ncbi:MAG: DUF5985 family protein [Bacteriovoracia bacterium]
MTELYPYLNGAMIGGYLVISAFFFRFRERTKDQLFTFFSVAFFLFAIEKIIFALTNDPSVADGALFYLIRLAGFALIIIGIVNKNWEKSV